MAELRHDVRKPFLPGRKIVKVTQPGQPDTWLVSGLVGCYAVDLTIQRTENGYSVHGMDRVTRVKIEDEMTVQDGRLRGDIFYVNKNRTGESYLNLNVDDDMEAGGDVL